MGKAQRQHATWFRKHNVDEHKAHFRAVVRPALEAAGVDMETLGECLSSASGRTVQAQASAAYARLLAARPPSGAAAGWVGPAGRSLKSLFYLSLFLLFRFIFGFDRLF